MNNILPKVHLALSFTTCLIVLLLAVQYWYFNVATVQDLLSKNIDILLKIILSTGGLLLFLKKSRVSLLLGSTLLAYWSIGYLFILDLQMKNDGVLHQGNWVGLIMFIARILALSLLAFPSCRRIYVSRES